MATRYKNVKLISLAENGSIKPNCESSVNLLFESSNTPDFLSILSTENELICRIEITPDVEVAKVGILGALMSCPNVSYIFTFSCEAESKSFKTKLKNSITCAEDASKFFQRTDPASAEQYFQFYGYLSQQQNMMQDYIRTSTYQKSMLNNCIDFQDKVVLDVGAGSGILSFFAIQSGAKKVYAIEASSMAKHCQMLVDSNKHNMPGSIEVIYGKIEEVELEEKVDIIISEPMGYMLFNERMLETYIHAKKWLKPGGKMFPTQGDLHITPFSDEALYMEQFSKANFWYQDNFHGVDLTSLRQAAVEEYFRQPIVDTFDIRICMARPHKYTVDFLTANEFDLHNIEIPVSFTLLQTGTIHGLAFWFDVAFIGSQSTVWLSTSPTEPLTHWYQVRCLLQNPIFGKQGQTLTGKVSLRSNTRQSYDVDIEVSVPGTNHRSSNTLDLKNPFFRYTGQPPQAPPGSDNTSPTENYWNQTESSNIVAATNCAPINPGCIPAATIINQLSPQSRDISHIQSRTSIGAGISPSVFLSQGLQSNHPVQNDIKEHDFNGQSTCSVKSTQNHLIASPQEHELNGQSACSVKSTQNHLIASSQNNSQYPQYLVSNQFMIGDYAVPGSMILPSQGLNLYNVTKSS